MVWLWLFGCASSVDDSAKDSSAPQDTGEQEDVIELQTGWYLVDSATTPANACNGDFSVYEGNKWRVWVSEEELDLEGLLMAREGNTLSGTDVEVNDWGGIGADCTTQTDSVFSGIVNSVEDFDWVWAITWSYVAGDGCDAALEMELPCTYEGYFHMQLDSILEEERE
jgi:hypothetical protein